MSETGAAGPVAAGDDRRSGTVALIGRPNSGKSSLLNRLLGEKVAIVSDKPQTTRHRLLGILTEPRGQVVFYDTPGIHRPLHRLNRRMMAAARDALRAADLVCVVVDGSVAFGHGDEYLLALVGEAAAPRLLALNKVDVVKKPRLLPLIERYARAGSFEEIVPLSALTGDGADLLLDLLFRRLPPGAARFDRELLTVHTERFLAAERIREKVLLHTRDDLAFASAVQIELWQEPDDQQRPVHIAASVLVERPGQKKIVIGQSGQMIKAIGTAARLELEEFLGRAVYLDLQVKLAARWREDGALLNELDRGLDEFT